MIGFNLYDLNVCLICLCLGYMLKHFNLFKGIANNWIPVILAIVSGVLYVVHHNNLAYFGVGMLLGLISVGSYEFIDQIILLIKEKGVDELCRHKKR